MGQNEEGQHKMRITEAQEAALKTLRCERLSDNEKNFRLIDDFENHRNDNIADSFRNEAYKQDEERRVAYYVVKDKENRILFFFSLKCGALFDRFLEAEKLVKITQLLNFIKERAKSGTDVEESEAINSLIEEARSKKIIKKDIVAKILHRSSLDKDLDEIFDENIKSVGHAYAGIELVHFCANDKFQNVWEEMALPQSMGVVVFWHFIVPIVEKLMHLVGCEYLYLFAADMTENLDLISYYTDRLKFCNNTKHTVAKPLYDFACKFLYQETKDLPEKRIHFFDHFNPDKDAV